MEYIRETSDYQRIWESLNFPKEYLFERKISYNPMIFFVVSGEVRLKLNDMETYLVSSHEMFMAQSDISYKVTMSEQTHLIICHVPLEVWYAEQKWISDCKEKDVSEEFFKLSAKKIIIRFFSLLDNYLKEGVNDARFFELKRHEFIFLLFFYYQKNELLQFSQCMLSKDIQFKKIIVDSYLNAKNVQELAKLVNYSTSGFIKKFKKCFDDSPYKWMQKQKAKQILIDISRGTKSLQEIANEYKFSSYQHFSVFCKAQLGAPPTAILEKKTLNYR